MDTRNAGLALRAASAEEAREIYEWMKQQFHLGELKPLDHIERLRAQGLYEIYGLWQGEALAAYALLGITADRRLQLLDYYAVLPEHQDAGLGSAFLRLLREKLSGDAILLEVEVPEYATDAEEREICERRIRFYDRNNCRHTGVSLCLFGFEYRILTIPLQGAPDDAQVRKALCEIYRTFFPPELYAANVHFHDSVR